MKAYLSVTAGLFGLVTAVHIWRAVLERELATEPWFILITAAAAFLCLWALRLLRRAGWPG